MRPTKRFEGDYIRGGMNTLYMTRQDVVQTLATIKKRYPGQLMQMLRESKEEMKYVRR